ncbi:MULTISPECIES: 50S ribosomal protein L30 [Kosmotoga]|uniref:Large ribosomal subunit protein uL30 n=1 Tax=Kosmotoga olearia (strain ATCC BAA-1733 / DSM 21960 / TBF 19.5.1) TaxID=521045 RepID=RL30_KOSOT|nr:MULTISPECIES: 50S ribosomal protein L30 [Kosmotoga]C5CGI4.1 RecName: Full=Large ribosomal subunit protein uL30; AltName: Full=50S ribosomal protein L30 [Kosmotoga olearia TBF 19.5.1]ACR80565.1 ribosomal protein L30 [Kosmotoga olearia TBF 19.5.1]MDI3523304.1 large subunit ribosomal protein [Kosmotoga sp.]MDK2952766.1 large subunit ribosomal protein [Kosmotoga sp.]OAA19433.1 50S ribosomal protein L30 [Kosmotoga sp. DU53]
MAKKLKIKLVKSPIGYNRRQRATLKALGLRKISDEVVHDDSPQIRGMINAVIHMLEVKEIEN